MTSLDYGISALGPSHTFRTDRDFVLSEGYWVQEESSSLYLSDYDRKDRAPLCLSGRFVLKHEVGTYKLNTSGRLVRVSDGYEIKPGGYRVLPTGQVSKQVNPGGRTR